jgi:hypothetical protein
MPMVPRLWIPFLLSVVAACAAAAEGTPEPARRPGQDPAQNPPDPMQDPDKTQDPDLPPPDAPMPLPEPVVAKPKPVPIPKVDLREIEKRVKEGEPEETGVAATWADRMRRDERITFLDRSAAEANAALDNPSGIGLRRAAAWMTLGSQGTPDDRLRIARAVRGEQGLERSAAVLALGQPQADTTTILAQLVDDPDAETAECALYALLRTGRPEAREKVEAVAADKANPRAAAAAALLAFAANPSAERVPRAARTWFELRWEAARAFGGIDGKRFAVLRAGELASSQRYCTAVVIAASGRSQILSAKDHLLGVLLSEKGPQRLQAAVQGIPRAVAQLVDNELWKPADAGEWATLLNEIERERAEGSTPEILEAAEEILPVRWKARELLARSGRFDIATFSTIDLPSLEPAERVSVCQILGSLSDPTAKTLLDRLADDPDASVRGALAVARMRLGDPTADDAIDRALSDRTRPERAAVLAALCRNAREPAISARLEKFAAKATGNELITVAVALCEERRESGRALVRKLLSIDRPIEGEGRRKLVRALCRRPTEQDRGILVDLFPQPGEDELNEDLAIGLARLSDTSVRPVIRAALWGPGFDVAVLAGLLLAEELGVTGVIEDIERPPVGTSPAMLRRAGFALGEWGGVDALKKLAQVTGATTASPEVQGALLGVLGARTQ